MLIYKEKLKLQFCLNKTNEERISFIQNSINIKLPKTFINFVRECDGGSPSLCDFEYWDEYKNKIRIDCVGMFLSLSPRDYSDFYHAWLSPPEFFPKDLVAFADTGGGDLICFDYRNNTDDANPPIVYWNHESDTGKDVSFIAKDFETFLTMLKEPNDLQR